MAKEPRSRYATPAPPMPFEGLGDKVMGVLTLTSLFSLVALRTKVGIRLLKKTYIAGVVILSLFFSWLGNVHLSLSLFGGLGVRTDDDNSLRNYALFVFLPLAGRQHLMRLAEEKRGEEPHTYWVGDGHWYGFIPLPDKYIDMLIDPFLTVVAGALLRYRLDCGLLGLALMISGCSLFVVEKMRHTQAVEHRRDRGDLTKEAEWDAREMRNPRGGDGQKSGGAAATIPTGNDDELRAVIEKRKLENSWDTEGENNDVR